MSATRRPSPFFFSCWVLAAVAFIELALLLSALALRPKTPPPLTESPEKTSPRLQTEAKAPAPPSVTPSSLPAPPRRVVVTPPPTMRFPSPEVTPYSHPTPTPPLDLPPSESLSIPAPAAPTPSPPDLSDLPPPIRHPKVERFVQRARQARLQGDHLLSLLELEEALSHDPTDPTTLYERALTFEEMGVYDRASDSYLQVFQLGPQGAGSLWKKAATKIEAGFSPDLTGLASLGIIRQLAPQSTPEGERHSLLVPLQVSPGREFDPTKLQTRVQFFEKRKDEITPAEISEEGAQWLSEPLDWSDGEELVEIWYRIPPVSTPTALLYGERDYYGYIAELYYDNELLDLRAFPRTLLSQRPREEESDLFGEELWGNLEDPGSPLNPNNYEPGDPLLPPLPQP